MNIWAVAGLRSADSLGIACAALAILASAEASASGCPEICAPSAVGGVFARAADRHLHQHGGDRRHDHHQQRADDAQGRNCCRGAAEEHAELRQHRDRAGDGRGDGHDQRVAIADVGELVRDHAGDLLASTAFEQTGGDGDGGVLRIAAGGEGVGLRIVHQVDARHRQAGAVARARAPCRRDRARSRASTSCAPCIDSTMRSEFQ